MDSRTLPFQSIIFFLSLTSMIPTLSFSSADSFVYGGCTEQTYLPNSPFESNLDSLLTSLVNSATYSSYNNFTFIGSTPQDALSGLYQCRGDLSMPDCASCIARAVSDLGSMCFRTCGGALQLEGCYIKYDNASFLGVEDKTVVLKKCGPTIGYDQYSISHRDVVFANMSKSSEPYRVARAEDVQGMAQCVGDLSVGECRDCVNEAIRQLKSDCGTAVYGDMFLGKCYTRYTTNGAHGLVTVNHDKSNNPGEKTFAIIIGLLAGVVLIIIFLIFMRKMLEGIGNLYFHTN